MNLRLAFLWPLSLLFFGSVEAEFTNLRPVINQGEELCHSLQSSDNERSAQGLVCFQLNDSNDDQLDVEIRLDFAEWWDIDEVFLWIGSNATDLPVTIRNDKKVPDLHQFPFVGRNIREKRAFLEVPLMDALGFACPNKRSEQVAAIHATVRSPDGRVRLMLNLVETKQESTETDSHVFVPFKLSCQKSNKKRIESPQNRIHHINNQATTAQRRVQSCPGYPSSIDFNFTEAEMTTIKQAWTLIKLVTRSESGGMRKIVEREQSNYEIFKGFTDCNDRAIVAKTIGEGYCYGSFMGTASLNPLDQLQNLSPCDMRLGDSDCVVRSGYFDAYNTSYKDEFRQELDACIASCIDGCPLVLTGHSQGAAAAVVAAIDLRQYSPTTITFGSPRPIMLQDDAPCTDFHAEKHYRFINTEEDDEHQEYEYDSVPFGTTSGSSSLGWTLFLNDMNWPIGSPGFNNDLTREPTNKLLHEIDLYRAQIDGIMTRGCYPVPVGRWTTGTRCRYNDECEKRCYNGHCE